MKGIPLIHAKLFTTILLPTLPPANETFHYSKSSVPMSFEPTPLIPRKIILNVCPCSMLPAST